MTQPSPTVTSVLTVHVVIPDQLPAPLPAELSYHAADPYAVRLSLGAPTARTVNWVFARSLLTEGLHRRAGTGDVLVLPRSPSRRHFIRVVLRSHEGSALIDIEESAVDAFLQRTLAFVPLGAERFHLDIDRLLAELTGRRD
ncbi:SsgA family sporulation/cell division regulator [Kitasatospora sp. NPDC049285]|uniref:SsgA family sporulation/cell division regulator n=1 Tax=Kitasatospora sp. NPDC049285 TaxID=3157096 RepID=UPI003427D621